MGDSDEEVLEYARYAVGAIVSDPEYNGWDAKLLREIFTITAATLSPRPTVTTRMTVPAALCNGSGNLHGGAIATIFDNCTSVPLMLQVLRGNSTWLTSGVTRTLNVTCLVGAPIGTEIEIVSELVSAGRRLGLTRGLMRRVKDGVVLATCEHNKAVVPLPGVSL